MKNINKLATLIVLASFITAAVLSAAQAYVRWKINQNFTFLGGGELEVITAGAFLTLIVLLYLSQKQKGE